MRSITHCVAEVTSQTMRNYHCIEHKGTTGCDFCFLHMQGVYSCVLVTSSMIDAISILSTIMWPFLFFMQENIS